MFQEWPLPTRNRDFCVESPGNETLKQAPGPQNSIVFASSQESALLGDLTTGAWTTDAELNVTALAPDLAELLNIDPLNAIGQSLVRYFKLDENEDGSLPLLVGLISKANFSGQNAKTRSGDGAPMLLSGKVLRDKDGRFFGYLGRAVPSAHTSHLVAKTIPESDVHPSILDCARLRTPLDQIVASAYKVVNRSLGLRCNTHGTFVSNFAPTKPRRSSRSSFIRKTSEVCESFGSVDLVSVASEAVFIVSSRDPRKRVAVDVMASSRVVAYGDKSCLVQIIVEILSNAIQSSAPGEPVVMSISESDGHALLTVANRTPWRTPNDQRGILHQNEQHGETEIVTNFARAFSLARLIGGSIELSDCHAKEKHCTLIMPLGSNVQIYSRSLFGPSDIGRN